MPDSPLAAFADYHTHTPLCRHAEGWPVDYARVAVGLGLGELGFADHNPMPEQFDDWRMLREELPRYFEAVAEARELFPRLPIRLGLECDFIPGREKWIEELAGLADWDFLIGSVHYLPQGWEVDHPRYVGRHEGHAEEIWRDYWRLYGDCIRSGFFDFVAHPDLPKKFGITPAGDLRRFYEPAVAALAETGVAFEMNTAGLRRDCREIYPARPFLELAFEAGVPMLINSDAHTPGDVGAGFGEAIAIAKEVGFTHTLRFERRRRTAVPMA
ncbi:MAG: histidinol-phosphatase HisJ family protein [Chthoniobacteraceae bacterium]